MGKKEEKWSHEKRSNWLWCGLAILRVYIILFKVKTKETFRTQKRKKKGKKFFIKEQQLCRIMPRLLSKESASNFYDLITTYTFRSNCIPRSMNEFEIRLRKNNIFQFPIARKLLWESIVPCSTFHVVVSQD